MRSTFSFHGGAIDRFFIYFFRAFSRSILGDLPFDHNLFPPDVRMKCARRFSAFPVSQFDNSAGSLLLVNYIMLANTGNNEVIVNYHY